MDVSFEFLVVNLAYPEVTRIVARYSHVEATYG